MKNVNLRKLLRNFEIAMLNLYFALQFSHFDKWLNCCGGFYAVYK